MHSPGINGEGELRGQPANPGSPGKMAVKTECVYVWPLFREYCGLGRVPKGELLRVAGAVVSFTNPSVISVGKLALSQHHRGRVPVTSSIRGKCNHWFVL